MHRFVTISVFLILAVPAYGQSDLAFPHLALGGTPAYETVLQVINEVEVTNNIVIDVYQGGLSGAANGTPLAVHFDGGAPATTLNVSLTPFQEFSTTITIDGTTLRNGWLHVRSTVSGGKISGSLLFRQRSGGTVIDSVGATSPQKFRRAVIQVDQRDAGSDTGVAFVNTDSTSLNVTLDLYQGPNPVATTVPVTLQPNQHFARLVSQIFPTFGAQQGTLVLEADPGREAPCMALRLDGLQLTSIPVRPLGFVFQYSITGPSGSTVETGFWMFDLVGFNLIGLGKIETPSPSDFFEVTGSWVGTSLQFRYRKTLAPGNIGEVVFNGTSAGSESTAGSDGQPKAVTGKVTTIGADGQAVTVYNFSAYHKFGPQPQ